ncbi:MAG: cadherin-like domain-containing protein, partial [Rhodospirillales bacterium]|nr:cadherin-like domain-containing protein [Rhodospirillales bacterium]
MLVMIAALAGWAPEAEAFDNWTDTATGNFDTNCAQCHGNFRANGYVSLKDGTGWSTSLMNGHRDFVSGECDVCHNSGGRFPAYTLWSAGGTGFENISCAGCHGRGDNASPTPAPGDNNQACVEDPTAYGGDAAICGAGAGLRRQHWTANRTIDTANGPVSTQICATCHADADPANFTPVDEDVPPSYYFTPDPVHASKPTDPCNADPAAAGAESKFGPTGLDNDGDGLVDGADLADCGVVNLPPVAVDDAYTTDEDTPLNVAAAGVLANDSDPNGDSITAVLVAGPARGSVTLNTDGSFEYIPDANLNGPDSFTYVANDGALDSNIATVAITVTPVNDAPVAVDDAYATDEDVVLNVAAPGVLGNDTDADGDPLSAVLDVGPANGTLALNGDGSFTYTPNANFNGPDSFTYHANDGAADSNIATVAITVNAVNDAPVAVDDSYTTTEDTALSIAAPGVLGNDSDVDGDPLT